MTIHLVIGPPCSGKSAFVATNAPVGTPRFDFDLVASTVNGADIKHDSPPAVMEAVLAMRRGLFGWVLDAETDVGDVWIINAYPSENTMHRFAAMGAVFHVLDPGIDECLARAERDNRPAGTEARIRAWYNNPPEIPEEKGGSPVKLKNFAADLKAAPDESGGTGRIVAYASVFDNVDSYGDVMRHGAFADTLKEWKDSGKTIPLLYGHNFADPFMNIGGVVEANEDDRGLKITADLDLDNPTAAQVHRLVKAGRLSEMSFAFNYRDAGEATVDGQQVFEVRSVELFEVSIVPIGANRETEILEAKAAQAIAAAMKNQPEPVPLEMAPENGQLNTKRTARENTLRAVLSILERV